MLVNFKHDFGGIEPVEDTLSHLKEKHGLLQTIYKNGKFYNQTTLTEIRNRLNS